MGLQLLGEPEPLVLMVTALQRRSVIKMSTCFLLLALAFCSWQEEKFKRWNANFLKIDVY